MRRYEREDFRRLTDAERYRDYDYLADDAWVGPNERIPHGLTRADEPPDGADEAMFEHHPDQHWRSPPSVWANPAGALEQRQFWQAFTDCLKQLPPRQAQVFGLCELDGLSGEETCKVLGLSASNLWVLMHRARLRLRQCLEIRWFGHGPG